MKVIPNSVQWSNTIIRRKTAMHDESTPNTSSGQRPFCPDRRTALKAFALAVGGVVLNSALPLPSLAQLPYTRRFRIVYKLNGGIQQDGQRKYIRWGKSVSVSKLKNPKRKGYKFVGWYSDERLKTKAVRLYGKVRKPKRTVYAKWRLKSYSITYNLNGGKAKGELPTSYTVKSKPIVFVEPEKLGYCFKGWYSDPEFTKSLPSLETGSAGNVTVHARWECAKYAIEYELDGGVETAPLPKSCTMFSSEMKLRVAPAKEGSRFAGWYADSKFEKPVQSIPAGQTSDVKLYARWVSADYWDEHLQAKCEAINEIAAGIANGLPSLVFITDMHMPTNAMVSPELVRRVVANTNTNMVVFGGDAINEQIPKNEALDILRYLRGAFGDAEVHMVRGNHDGNRECLEAISDEKVGDAEFLSIARHESEVRDNDCINCYRDDEDRKVRFIFLDSKEPETQYVDEQQIAWLKDRVLELEEGWTVLVFVHQFYSLVTDAGGSRVVVCNTSGKVLKAALDSVYDEAQATIAGVVSGHMHKDYAEYSEKGYPIVSTTCDSYSSGRTDVDYSYRLGTVSEQAFDVISLDTEQRMLYFTRVGNGKDRSFGFGAPSSPDAPEDEQLDPDTQLDSGTLQAGVVDSSTLG